MTTFSVLRGMRDFLPKEAKVMRFIEGKAREVARLYSYMEVITPVVESYELLAAKTGEEVRSRMYVFEDLGGRKVALRPEFTASVARLVSTSLRTASKPLRLFCVGSLYRYDEPQRGRFREFWQSNFELMGSQRPEADAEILLLTNSLMKLVGLRNYRFKINHVGIIRSILTQEGVDEETQNRALQLMDKRMYENAIRLLEDVGASKGCIQTIESLIAISGGEPVKALEEIRAIISGYNGAMAAVDNLAEILKLVMEVQKLDIAIEAGFARGLEYYTGMIFEVYVPELDIAIAGGGRYDKLVELFGGEPTPAVGVAHGIDRIMLAMQEQQVPLDLCEDEKVVVIPVSEALRIEALRISEMLRANNISVEVEVMGRKVSRALEDADRRGCTYAIIVGEQELREGKVVLRDMHKRSQQAVKIGDLVQVIRGAGSP
ncbi:MAG: histidine--tRNA ligase [Candidatus Bathyarchaeia archaeon]